jgi:hypothetical protein
MNENMFHHLLCHFDLVIKHNFVNFVCFCGIKTSMFNEKDWKSSVSHDVEWGPWKEYVKNRIFEFLNFVEYNSD